MLIVSDIDHDEITGMQFLRTNGDINPSRCSNAQYSVMIPIRYDHMMRNTFRFIS